MQVFFLYWICKKVCIFAIGKIARTILSPGSDAGRKVRAARATMLPNGKRLQRENQQL